jgi:glycosyltransferase involved in cell wall biosynthesis
LFLDDHLKFLPRPSESLRWIGTIHLPRRCWKPTELQHLGALTGVFVLSDSMRDDFSDILSPSRVRVLPHGVDTNFFKPRAAIEQQKPQKFIYVGAWLRNTAMLARLIPEISRKFPGVIFDLVVPLFARRDEALSSLLSQPSVRWYHNLTDEELRERYQTSTAMLMPMEDSGANNAIVEALACGLPVITTNTGGIGSYGGGTAFPVVENNDDRSCFDLAATYLTQPEFASSVSKRCRAFAESKLDWTVAAGEYLQAYRSMGFA